MHECDQTSKICRRRVRRSAVAAAAGCDNKINRDPPMLYYLRVVPCAGMDGDGKIMALLNRFQKKAVATWKWRMAILLP